MVDGRNVLRGFFYSGNDGASSEGAIGQVHGQASDFANLDPPSDSIDNRQLDEVAYWRHQVGWRDDDYYDYDEDATASGGSSNGTSGSTTPTVMTIVTVIKVVGLIVAATILLLLFRAIRRRFAESKKNNRVSPSAGSDKRHNRSKSSPSARSSSSVHSRARSKSSGRSRSKSRSRRSKSVGGTPKSGSTPRSGAGSDYSLMSDEISTRSGRDTASRRGDRPSSRMSRSRSRSRHRSNSRNGTPRDSVSSPRQDSIDSIDKREMLV
mmetsp:Transcript_1201/g.2632  ORF Transcript_1201/g.2632 Transcript_1201/m.2632 type:complete len:266 (+) Transcript_1201:343-1140(+)